jgi:hypothetical protein
MQTHDRPENVTAVLNSLTERILSSSGFSARLTEESMCKLINRTPCAAVLAGHLTRLAVHSHVDILCKPN